MGGTAKKGRAVKKQKASGLTAEQTEEEYAKAPHSFVIHRGKVGKAVQELAADFRKVMEPYTATNVKVRPKNVIKDFVHVAGLLHVSHMASFTKTELGPYVKLARFPRGPTLTFKINDYTLARDVRSSLKRQVTYDKQFLNHALLIMNSFTGEGKEIQLMTSMFQNMFPSLNVTKVKLNAIRRCVLLNYDAETKTIDFRHYTIKVVPVGMSKGVKKIVQGKVPNLSKFEDVSEFLTKSGNLSESEFEDDETSRVTLPQEMGSRGNQAAQQSSIRLVELGPRMSLELIKIEEGLHDGEVLYHKLVEKTDEEKKAIRVAREKKKKEKEQRKKQQDQNVKKKEKSKEDHKKKSLAGMAHKRSNENLPEGFKATADEEYSSEDDDAQYYEDEVGEKPDKDMFDTSAGFRKRRGSSSMPNIRGGKRFRGGDRGRGSSRGGSGDRGRGGRGMSRGGSGDRGRGGRGMSRGGSGDRGRGGRGMSRGGDRGRGGRGMSRGGDRGRGGRGMSRGGDRGRGGRGMSRGRSGSRGGPGSSRGSATSGHSDRSKPKRERKMFNSQGVGPNYNKDKINKGPSVKAGFKKTRGQRGKGKK